MCIVGPYVHNNAIHSRRFLCLDDEWRMPQHPSWSEDRNNYTRYRFRLGKQLHLNKISSQATRAAPCVGPVKSQRHAIYSKSVLSYTFLIRARANGIVDRLTLPGMFCSIGHFVFDGLFGRSFGQLLTLFV